MSYVERLGVSVPGGNMLTGGVQEEWFSAHHYVRLRVMNSVPVVRRGDHEYYDELPWEMKRHGGFDLREEYADQYETNIEKIAGFLHFERRHDDPPIEFGLADWIDLYIAWCRAHYAECAETPVSAWTWSFHRPNQFLNEYWEACRAKGGYSDYATIRSALTQTTKEPERHSWGDHLGLAVKAVSEGGVGRPHLAATLASYKEAECTRAGTLARDVVTQNNLGVALALLGKIDSRREPLLDALDAFRTALSLIAPSDQKWAITQNSLADALRSLARLESGIERCREAIVVYRDVLNAIGKERSTLWARACCGLADALRLVAERMQSPDGLDEARQLLAQALPIFEEADKGEMPFIKPAYSTRDGIRDCKQALVEVERVSAQLNIQDA